MRTPIRAKVETVAPKGYADLHHIWEPRRTEIGKVELLLSFRWVVGKCPFCGGIHMYEAGPVHGDPKLHLKIVPAGCEKAQKTSDDDVRMARWKSYELADNNPVRTDALLKRNARVFGVLGDEGMPEVTCLLV